MENFGERKKTERELQAERALAELDYDVTPRATQIRVHNELTNAQLEATNGATNSVPVGQTETKPKKTK